MEQTEQFNDFLRRTQTDFINTPIVVDEYGVYRLVGYHHVISCDYEFNLYQGGISENDALDIFNKEIQLCESGLISKYNELSETKKYDQLNIGCRRLLLLLLYTTGNIKQFDKAIAECQENRLYQALQFSGRKNVIDDDESQSLQQLWEEEKEYFRKNFDKFGNPIGGALNIIENDDHDASFFLSQRFEAFQQGNIVPLNSSFTQMHYLSKEFLEFTKDQQGKIYNFSSYNEGKWFPVDVPDQSFKIIGYSHRCSQEEEERFSVGLQTEHVNHLFLLDYQKNCTLLKRYLQQNHPKYNFEELTSQVQLFLIDIAFRNLAFDNFDTAIKLALENNINDAIEASNIYYRPDLNVYVHYLERVTQLQSLIKLVDEQFCSQKCDWNDEKYNNIIGIKMNSQGFQFIFDAGAANKIKINDLITCLKVLYDPELDEDSKILYFSLEFEDNDFEMQNPYQKKVYFPEYLEGSEVGEILYESDFILKQMSLGIEVLNKAPLQVQEFNYGTLEIQPLYKIDPDYFARLFIKYGSGDLKIVDDSMNDYRSYVIENIKLVVDAKYLDENGQDQPLQDPENAAVIFANKFANLYDNIAQRYPVFTRLKEIFMANMLAKYMYNQKLKIDYKFVHERFQQNLIQNYQKSQSPTLRMNIENEIMEFNLTGGVTTDIQNNQAEINQLIEQQRTQPVTKQTETQIKTNDATFNVKVSELDQVSTISTQPSVSDLHDLLPKKKCGSCPRTLEQCEQDEQNCQACKGLQCQKCYQNFQKKGDLRKILDKNICQKCIKCFQCNKQISKVHVGEQGELFHENCLQISKQSPLKTEIKAIIKSELKTKIVNNNYHCDEYKCLNLPKYTNYIVGYFRPLFTTDNINSKQHRVTQEQADSYLETDMKTFETQMSEFYTLFDISLKEVQENLTMMRLFALFIIKDSQQDIIVNLFSEKKYGIILDQLQNKVSCPNKEKHQCTFKEKLKVLMSFFNKKYDKNGAKKEKTFLGPKKVKIQEIELPTTYLKIHKKK